ncbi:MAG: SRPBCC family protein [Candidatus Dormibacteraceae bacterium]
MKLHNATDRIEKEIVLRAPRSRVWRALADIEEFGTWFGMKLEGTFAPGARAQGRIDLPGHGHVTIEIAIERMDPESRMSYRWHPYSSEPTTLVEFQLEEVAEGTRLRVVESGFDRIPAARRAEALRMNDAGWAEQLQNIARDVAS